jgi:hypothetical protein
MAGAATTYFTAKREAYQAQVTAAQEQAAAVTAKMQAANTALGILGKSTITQADAENLISLYEQVS